MRSRDQERLEQYILVVGLQMLNRQSAETTSATGLRRFKAMFGVSHLGRTAMDCSFRRDLWNGAKAFAMVSYVLKTLQL